MKHERKLKRWMKVFLKAKGFNWENWYYVKDTPKELHIIHKHSLNIRIIEKEGN